MKGKKASRARQICNLLDSPSLSGDERIGCLPFVISFAICPTLSLFLLGGSWGEGERAAY